MSEEPAVAAPPRRRGVVVTAHPDASEAGRRAFAAGGNAVDAAIAAAWALAVCEPSGSGLGGQTVLVLHVNGRTLAVDGHSRAPAAVSVEALTRSQQSAGHRASTVPTTPATLAYVHERWGELPAERVLEPAITLAESGYRVSRLQHRQAQWCQSALAATPSGARFLRTRQPYKPDEVFVQAELGACLRRMVEAGVADFYGGEIARSIDRDMRRNGGLLTLADLEAVEPPIEREPLVGPYRGHTVLTMPPPGGGPQLLHALATLDELDPAGWRGEQDGWYLAIGRAVRRAFRNRERAHRRPVRPEPVLHGVGRERDGETTHLCAADSDGNVVSLTQSIQSLFGAKVANPEFGFLYNNYLTTCPRRRHAHRLAGGCSARSNAAPTLIFSDGCDSPTIALGAAGSRRIISSLVHVVSGVIDRGLQLDEAVAGPRIHPRSRASVWLERPAAGSGLVERLTRRYGEVQIRSEHSYAMGAVQALQIETSGMAGAADPRRDGTTARW
jgi:gamma-glutamyltranspeptidase/glutathione hydrolase